jgi:hypothetical protein
MRFPQIGDVVDFMEFDGKEYPAQIFLIQPHTYGADNLPAIGLVFVKPETPRHGSVVERLGVPHRSMAEEPDPYWSFPEE